jgi:hypothetical protein
MTRRSSANPAFVIIMSLTLVHETNSAVIARLDRLNPPWIALSSRATTGLIVAAALPNPRFFPGSNGSQ